MTTSSLAEPQSYQCELKQKPFARIFLKALFGLTISVSAFAVTLKARPADQFVDFQKASVENQFWHRKNLWDLVENNRKIPVSVTKPKGVWNFKGAGVVQVPREFCERNAKDFKGLSQLPDYFPEVSFDEAKSILHLKVKFLKSLRPLDLALFEDHSENETRIYLRSIGEWMTGAEGVFVFKDLGRQRTEVAHLAHYEGSLPYVPDWLFRSSVEAVMHYVAESLRKTLETDYKKQKGV